MVSASTQSLLAEIDRDWDDTQFAGDTSALTTGRSASRKKEQSSSGRYATQRRFSRRQATPPASKGPRRRFRKSVA